MSVGCMFDIVSVGVFLGQQRHGCRSDGYKSSGVIEANPFIFTVGEIRHVTNEVQLPSCTLEDYEK